MFIYITLLCCVISLVSAGGSVRTKPSGCFCRTKEAKTQQPSSSHRKQIKNLDNCVLVCVHVLKCECALSLSIPLVNLENLQLSDSVCAFCVTRSRLTGKHFSLNIVNSASLKNSFYEISLIWQNIRNKSLQPFPALLLLIPKQMQSLLRLSGVCQ